MKIIGIAGKAGGGKDTAAGYILEWASTHGVAAKQDAYGNRLKISAAAAFGVADEDAIEWCARFKQSGVSVIVVGRPEIEGGLPPTLARTTGRKFLQDGATAGHREVFGYDFWVKALWDCYSEERGALLPDLLVVSDCRFPNEVEAIHKRGGKVWEIQGRADEGVPTHVSETEVLETDLTIDNSGDRRQLRSLVFATAGAELNFEPRYA